MPVFFGLPLVDSYRIQHSYFVEATNPEYKVPWNQIKNTQSQHGLGGRA